MKKLFWVNAQHIKATANAKLIELITPQLQAQNIVLEQLDINAIIELVKARSDNLNTLAKEVAYLYQPQMPNAEELAKHMTGDAVQVLNNFASAIDALSEWSLDAIKTLIKEFCVAKH